MKLLMLKTFSKAINIMKTIFVSESDKALKQATQKGCGVSISFSKNFQSLCGLPSMWSCFDGGVESPEVPSNNYSFMIL